MSRRLGASLLRFSLIIAWMIIARVVLAPEVGIWPLLCAFTLLFTVVGFGSLKPELQIFGPVIRRARVPQKRLAITFDDGPHPHHTRAIMDVLEQHGARGTFFVRGDRVRRHPEVVAEIVRRGHQVASHGDSHDWKLIFRLRSLIADMQAADRAIVEATGISPRYFRPPVGVVAPETFDAARALGYEVVGWSIRPYDGRISDPIKVQARVQSKIQDGEIVLLHDAPSTNPNATPPAVQALPGILAELRKHDTQAVTLATLMGSAPHRPPEQAPAVPARVTRRSPVPFFVGLTLLLLGMSSQRAFSAEPPAKTLSLGALPEGLTVAAKALAAHRTVSARFEQRKSSILFTEDVVRAGSLLLRNRDGRLLWSYDQGPSFLMADGSFHPAGDLSDGEGKAAPAKGFVIPGMEAMSEIMEGLFRLDPELLRKHFRGSEIEPGSFRLVPIDAVALFDEVLITIGGDPLALRAVRMTEATGDVTTITFSKVIINGDVPVDAFRTPAERRAAAAAP